MKAIEFEGQQVLMRPPSDMKRGTCGALPVMVRQDGENGGAPIRISVWKPDEADLQALANGAHVLLHVWGASQPPVALTVQKMVELP